MDCIIFCDYPHHCCQSPFHLSYVADSRPCCLAQFNANQTSVLGSPTPMQLTQNESLGSLSNFTASPKLCSKKKKGAQCSQPRVPSMGFSLENNPFLIPQGERGYCQNMGFTGMCSHEGYGFQAVYSGIGSINQRVWVQNRVSFFRKLINWLKIYAAEVQ